MGRSGGKRLKRMTEERMKEFKDRYMRGDVMSQPGE
jgi:hypothetical protein